MNRKDKSDALSARHIIEKQNVLNSEKILKIFVIKKFIKISL